MLEDILDAKLMPVKAKIDDLTDQMKEFHKFIDRARGATLISEGAD